MKYIVGFLEITFSIIFILISLKNLEMKFFSFELKFFVIFTILILLLISIILNNKYKKIKKMMLFLSLFINIFILCYSILYKLELLEYFNSVTKLKNLILSFGTIGIVIFIILSIGQVVMLPIPSIVLIICGNLIYGPMLTTLFCSIGVIIGSLIAFLLGKVFGLKLVRSILSDTIILKYNQIMNNNGKLLLSLAFILPLFPDDVLCLLAGISNLKLKDFMIIVSTLRPVSMLFMCYFSGGKIIPFSGWGIYVWILIIIIIFVLIILYLRYKSKIQNWFKLRLNNIKKKSMRKS